MKVRDLSGNLHTWNLKSNPRKDCSQYHAAALALLKRLYPMDNILQEVAVPGENLYLDLFIPLRKLVIEIHGEQHYSYNSHFFANKLQYVAAQGRDQRKIDWCELNNLEIVVLKYNDDASKWAESIINR